MQQNRKVKYRTRALGATVAALAVAGSLAVSASTVSADPVDAEYSPEEIMRGVVFNEGIVAEDLGIKVEFPQSADFDDDPEYTAIVNDLTEAMIQSDPRFLEDQAQLLTSGNPYQVEKGIDGYIEKLNEVIIDEFPELDNQGAQIQPMCGVVAVCVAASVAYIVAGAAVVVVTFHIGGMANAIYIENGVWGENSYTSARSVSQNDQGSFGENLYRDEPSLAESKMVKTLTAGLAGK